MNYVFADEYTYSNMYAIYSLNKDLIIIDENGSIVSANENPITIERQIMHIINNGHIYSDIDLNGYDIYVTNTGTMDGNFINNNNGSLTQNITNNSEITSLNVIGGDFTIAVNNFNGVQFDSLKNLTADNFTFENSSVVINNFQDWNNFNKNISFIGDANKIYITNSYTVDSGAYIKFIDGTTNISVTVIDSDKLHKASLDRTLSGIILNIVRETDYTKIFDDKRGDLLNKLRNKSPNNKTLYAMDNAKNLNELNSVMSKSYMFNQKILIRPMTIINKFYMMDMINDEESLGFGIKPFYMDGDKNSGYGVRAYFANKYSDKSFNLGFHLSNFQYTDNLNKFSGMEYGIDIKAKTKVLEEYWLRVITGIGVSNFKADYIYVDNDIKKNPYGFSWYGGADIGKDYIVRQDLKLSPFAGINIQTNSVLDDIDTDINLRLGSELQYSFITDGIRYEYGASAAIDTNGDLFGNIKLGFVSISDKTGANIDFDVFNDSEYGTHYKLSINAKTMF